MLSGRTFFRTISGRGVPAAVAVIALGAGPACAAATLTTLASFAGTDGVEPVAGLVLDAAGDLFGTTQAGGANAAGTVFEIVRTASGYAGTPTVLHSFGSFAGDGLQPVAGLVLDAAGDLFGTTQYGGANDAGTVFEIAKTASGYAGTPTILYSFQRADGLTPAAGLVLDAAGDLFGTTQAGGSGGGTVFEIAKTASGYAGTPTILYSFQRADGLQPVAGLVLDAAGDLFGTTSAGGANDQGTVFEIAKTASGYAGTPTVLHSFGSFAGDGSTPVAGLVLDAAGDLFGTTQAGGANNEGTVFEIVKTASGYAGTPTILHSFGSFAGDGVAPVAGLVLDAAGDLFGTTQAGGANTSVGGTVFEIAKTASGYAGTPTILYSFQLANGVVPVAGLIADAAGDLFGTTQAGGATNKGTVFELSGSGFVPFFAGTPGKIGCIVKSTRTLIEDYHGLNNAAVDLGYPGIVALETAIFSYCWGV